ncbi:hypothetical protein [Tsukamurella pseudospumae]|uniref:Uncharacterized protein n=1 Tax=Tsukamurella pseudospumae TaxID=239498 RepID=A0A138AUE7_9ACTN|nr:hypothetical protein [Tsukamurella pseudospumae]KXO97700.1 hypothetical protein AXK61_21950 [Tsukamurella pseudospumae]KXP14075.1 hypothetical protein AXK60_21525 [Tsukamurella pseudospumae]
MGDFSIEYWFGDGDGNATRWTSPGTQGAVRLDFDGDGRVDDAMIDLDGDGRADVAALDLDDDGVRETRYRDDGSGTWSQPAPAEAPTTSAAPAPPAGTGTIGTAPRAPSTCPIPGVGRVGEQETNPPVTPVPAEAGQPPRQAVVDTDNDGAPDVLLFDTDGDGTVDGATPLAR